MRIMPFLLLAMKGSSTMVTASEKRITARPKLPVSA